MSHHGMAPGVAGRFRGLSRPGRLLVFLAGLTTAGLLLVLVIGDDSGGPFTAGDCLTGDSPSTFRVIDCDNAAARWRVVARLDGRAEADFDNDDCHEHPRATKAAYLHGHRFSRGYVLCLEALR